MLEKITLALLQLDCKTPLQSHLEVESVRKIRGLIRVGSERRPELHRREVGVSDC